ncbi:hypothetical protein [Nitrosopumilus spindle-shaped virus]|uniref:Uncharacterized protein n=1 Tax=Nitrosopumilus spindle-shaped virus TaxID=2508184 RepID=A0A514K354_9VIRU|nr:hypothetical protein [Nitrosopumilus spindle-shaped virus]
MASFTVIVRNLENTKTLEGVTVTAKYLDWFGNDKEKQGITDSEGKVIFNIGVIQTDIKITASKNGSIDKDSLFVNIAGQAEPDTITLNLAFKPLEGTTDIIKGVTDFAQDQAKVLVIITGVVLGISGIIYVATKAKSTSTNPQSISNDASKVASKSKEKIKETGSKIKGKFPNLKK